MKILKIVLVCSFSFIFLTGFFFNNPIKDDFFSYVDTLIPATQADELEVFDIYCATMAGNYSNQLEMMSRVLEKTLIPKVDKINKRLALIYPATVEVKSIHDNKVESFYNLKEHLVYLKKYLGKYIILKDSALDISIISSAKDFERHYLLWREQLLYYSKKYNKNLNFVNHKHCLARLKNRWES